MGNLRCLCVFVALLFSCTVNAHHGSSGQFDTNATVELSGKITRIRLVNPHAYVYFDAVDTNGTVTNMRCELQSGSLLKRRGWTADLFKTGSEISIKGSPDRTDPTTCYMKEITFENGMTATRNSEFDDDGHISTTLDMQEEAINEDHHDDDHEEFHDTHEDEESEKIRSLVREDGSPNFAGNWAMVRKAGAPPGAGGEMAELTQAGKAAIAGASSADNPRFQCEPTNIIMDWWFDLMVNKIEQSSSQMTLSYGFMSLKRTIYLDGTRMPSDYQRNRAGFSTGKWEGDILVVTTTGFDEGWIMAPLGGNPGGMPPGGKGERGEKGERPPRPDNAGGPPPGTKGERPKGRRGPPSPAKNSTEMTIVERFSLNADGTVLKREYTITDPLYLKSPMTGSDEVTLTHDKFTAYECEDLTAERGSDSLGGIGVTRATSPSINMNNHENAFLYWLEDSSVGMAISSTQWGYPIVLSLHAIGMATMVGVALMICLRALGFASSIALSSLAPYWHVALIGFAINLLSGTALFFGNASELFYNWAFRSKILLVALGIALTWRLVNKAIMQTPSVSSSHKRLAVVTLLSWVLAIVAGRLIGYLS